MIKIKRFPQVLKNSKLQQIEVVYRNRVEIYKLVHQETVDGWQEVQMAEGNGFRHVNTIQTEAI